MIGRKRDTMLKEVSLTLTLVGALSSKRIFKCRVHGVAVDRGFSRENASFPLVVVMRNLAPKIHPATCANQRIDSIVRNFYISVQFILICREHRRNRSVGGEKTCGHS